MAGSYPEILRDQAGNPIPQIWDEANQRWLPYTGEVALKGQTVAEVKTQADAVGGVVTFSSPITAVEILNLDSVNHGTFTVNGLAITVPRGSAYRSYIGGTPDTTVSVAGSTQYEIRRLV